MKWAAALVIVLMAGCTQRRERDVTLWVWERSEDLRGIDPDYRLAILLLSIESADGSVRLSPRRQPLKVDTNREVTAVARLDLTGVLPKSESIAEAISQLPKGYPVSAIQVDFDALVTQRAFYGDLLRQIRKRLPVHVPLSITALASWCMDDPWIRNLPIEEAVPMLFEMGPDRDTIARRLEEGEDFRVEKCRKSVGLSTQEIIWRIPPSRRLFIFSRHGWTRDALRTVQNLRSSL